MTFDYHQQHHHHHELKPYDYYHRHDHNCAPCPPGPGLSAYPAAPWEKAIFEHNKDKNAHPDLIALVESIVCNYCYRDSIVARDAIADKERRPGMMVYVAETDIVYRLEEGLSNTNWKELNINSQQYIKLGRYNPPSNPSIGTIFFDLREERLKVYLKDWISLPNQLDINYAIQKHDSDPNAHAERFAEVENVWFTI